LWYFIHDYNAQQSKGLSRHHYYRITTWYFIHDYNAQQSKGLSRHHYYRITTQISNNPLLNSKKETLAALLL
ncbi:MAG: hypothetical protein PX481_26180, partial [Microcystis sp. M53603_WE2]|uniref:hypothetical protein n=1 Tax=Microcystis sp. M53603_WE2 TaxID=3030678 RepID=UPI0025834DE7